MAKSQANVSTVELSDGRVICLSYGVPVAMWMPWDWCPYDADCATRGETCEHCKDIPRGGVKTDRRYSVTSSKHANQFIRRMSGTQTEVPHEIFEKYVSPLKTKD